MSKIGLIRKQLKDTNIKNILGGFQVFQKNDFLHSISFQISLKKIIWPAREGELIEDVTRLPTQFDYSLSYPGTASTKSMVLFTSDKEGIFIGGKPSEEYCKIRIQRVSPRKFKLSYESKEHDLLFIPFDNNWKDVVEKYRKFYRIKTLHLPKKKSRFLLQIGVIGPDREPYINDFNELRKPVDYFLSELGNNHVIHFYATNREGYDRMYPSFEMAPSLGGEKSMRKLISYIKSKGFLTSHHFNPRIADYNWVKANSKYKEAVISGNGWRNVPEIELYKGHPFYVMNPNHPLWIEKCIETIKKLHALGFDYIQLDQFSYQRIFYSKEKPYTIGYKELIREVERAKINYWLEGVNDQYHPKGINFSQILVRDKPVLWEDFELRRGYPFGKSYPKFYTTIYPNENYAYQVMTEDCSVKSFKSKLKIAKKINAMIYDLQMDYYNKEYMNLLKDVVKKIIEHS